MKMFVSSKMQNDALMHREGLKGYGHRNDYMLFPYNTFTDTSVRACRTGGGGGGGGQAGLQRVSGTAPGVNPMPRATSRYSHLVR